MTLNKKPSTNKTLSQSLHICIMEYWKLLRKHIGPQRVIMPSSLGAITNHEGKILLIYHKDLEQWGFPGGLQNLNESIKETAKREILEELGVSIEATSLIGVYSSPQWHHSFSNGDMVQNLSFLFKMNGFNSSMKIAIEEEEIETYGFFDFDNLPDNCSPLTFQQCKDIVNFNGQTFVR